MNSSENSISLPFKEDPDCRLIKEKARRALLNLGFSPDLHIYEWGKEILEVKADCPEKECLIKMKRFYDALDTFQKRVLLAECLEYGRVYPFWYYGWTSEPAYRKERRNVLSRFKKAIE